MSGRGICHCITHVTHTFTYTHAHTRKHRHAHTHLLSLNAEYYLQLLENRALLTLKLSHGHCLCLSIPNGQNVWLLSRAFNCSYGGYGSETILYHSVTHWHWYPFSLHIVRIADRWLLERVVPKASITTYCSIVTYTTSHLSLYSYQQPL